MPWFLQADAQLQVLGWGMWLPGMGFVALGGWWLLAAALVIALFAVAFFAWFGSGMIVAPAIIWAGSAMAAAAFAGQAPAPYAPIAVPALTIAYLAIMAFRRQQRAGRLAERRKQREVALPKGLAALHKASVAPPPSEQRELSAFELSLMRYQLDRSLQPIGQLQGFDRIDQFQTSALRYQLNMLGYGLGAVQRNYMPNFHGYLSAAQRRLIEQYLQKDIWNYWKLENAWGNLSLRGDPARKDNIMLTGYLPIQVLLYQNNTGDDRYSKPAGLSFVDGTHEVYRHDIHSIIGSVLENYNGRWKQDFCLFPCEPNWIYPACNIRGLTSIRIYDTVFGTNHFAELSDRFRHNMEQEFMRADGSMVQLRSKLTGHEMPFPAPDTVVIRMLNPLYPDIAKAYWGICREEEVMVDDGHLQVRIPEKGFDFGNYKPGVVGAYDAVIGAASEMGDMTVVEAAKRQIMEGDKIVRQGGVASFAASNFINASLIDNWFNFRDGWRDAITTRPPEAVLSGPILAEAPYPEVLVAHASSSGEDLRLVLYPGAQAGTQTITLARLSAGRRYRVAETGQSFAADATGKAVLSVMLNGRTPLHVMLA
ncbi:MAG: hypothetical protein ABW048_14650 [Sphingobium sp.]